MFQRLEIGEVQTGVTQTVDYTNITIRNGTGDTFDDDPSQDLMSQRKGQSYNPTKTVSVLDML